ncbi:MAG: hypothetical protein ABW000_12030 [Actinoplanes sp.]
MESPASLTVKKTRRPAARIVAGLALVLLLLLVLFGRWISPNLLIGTSVTGKWCEDKSGYCVEHVVRGERVFLAPFDELHLIYRAQPRYYAVTNPFGSSADLSVQFGEDGVRVTDGSAVLSWPAATVARIGD